MREDFAADHDAAVSGALAHWEKRPESALALVMLLDQVPRHIFPHDAACLGDRPSRAVAANRALARGFDRAVPPAWRLFFYLPFEHSEIWTISVRGLELIWRSRRCRGAAPTAR